MNKIILTLLFMLVIFPIANADGKILRESDSMVVERITKIVPDSNERFSNDVDNDTIKPVKELSTEETNKIEEVIENAAIVSSGVVSWYGAKFHGRKTASGEVYDKNELTAAHKTLPFGTKVKVTNIRNGKSVVVEINDRGPYAKSRVLDLSQAAFSEIGHTNSGVMHVEYEILDDSSSKEL
ncbi:MAG: septal ring lytic transglycosylase RlpA family protein [Weeksellaceae bacterium]|nr:septal ring lytic transglycosylase RlpA family protein [Weeksellaceae bacterium]